MASNLTTSQAVPHKDSQITRQTGHIIDLHNLPMAAKGTRVDAAQVFKKGQLFYYHHYYFSYAIQKNKYGLCSLLKENNRYQIVTFDELKVKTLYTNDKEYTFYSELSAIKRNERNFISAIQSLKTVEDLVPHILLREWNSHLNNTPFISMEAFLHHFISLSANVALIRSLINYTIDWSYIDDEGNSFIHAACLLEKNDELAQSIIDKTINHNKSNEFINCCNSENISPLALCLLKMNPYLQIASYPTIRLVEYLIEKGATLVMPEGIIQKTIRAHQLQFIIGYDEKKELILAFKFVEKGNVYNSTIYIFSKLKSLSQCQTAKNILMDTEDLIPILKQNFDVLLQANCPQLLDYIFDRPNGLISKLDKIENGLSMLHIAVRNASQIILQHILTDVNNWEVVDSFSNNLLHAAIQCQNFVNLEILLNTIPKSPLKNMLFVLNNEHIVPSNLMINDQRAFECLFIAMTKECNDRKDNTFIHIAIENGKFECLQYLTSKAGKKYFSSKNSDSVTPLQLAITKSCTQSVELLLQYSTESIDYENNFGCNCLHSSIIHYNDPIFKMVLLAVLEFDKNKVENKLIDKTTRNTYSQQSYVNGPTPFLLSIKLNKLDATKLLVSHGANTGKSDNNRHNIFYYLLEYCKERDFMKKVLNIEITERNLSGLEHASEIQDYNIGENGILNYFYQNGNLESFSNCFEGISLTNKFKRNRDKNTILQMVLDLNDNEFIEYLLRKLSDLLKTRAKDEVINFINSVNNQHETALSLAVRNVMHSFVEQIIELGADIDTIYPKNDTILHIAIDTNDSQMIGILLKHPKIKELYGKKNNNGQVPIIELMKSGKGDTPTGISIVKGASLLHSAVQMKDTSIQTNLFSQIEIRSEMKLKNKDGRTPLHYAIMHKNINAIRTLIDHNVDLLDSDSTGKTAIHFAIDVKDEIIWTLIFQYLSTDTCKYCKEIIDKQGIDNVNLLQYSILENNLTAVRDILTLNPNLFPPHPQNNTIIHLAVQSPNFVQILSHLFREIDKENLTKLLQTTNKRQLPPLHYAISCDNTEALKIFDSQNLQIAVPFKGKLTFFSPIFNDKLILCKISTSHPYTPRKAKFLFGYKVESGIETLLILTDIPQLTTTKTYRPNSVEVVKRVNEEELPLLLQVVSADVIIYAISNQIIDLQKRFSNGYTLLHLAAKFGSCQILNYLFTYKGSNELLSKHLGILTLDSERNSIIYYGLQSNNNEVLPLICQCVFEKSKANNFNFFDIPNSKGFRPLDECLVFDKLAGFETLLSEKFGVNLIYIDTEGSTLLHKMIQNQSSKKFISPFLKALKQKYDSNNIRKYLECKTQQGYNALHLITSINEFSLLNILLEHFKENFVHLVDSQTNDTLLTPLHIASLNQYLEIVRILLTNGANPNIQDCEGKSALHYVTMLPKNREKNEKLIVILLNCHGSLALKDRGGRTPVFYAVIEQNDIALKEIFAQNVDFLDTDNDEKTIIHYSIDVKQDVCWKLLFSKFKAEVSKGNFKTFDLFLFLLYCMNRNNLTAFRDLLGLNETLIITDTHWVELIATSIGSISDCSFFQKLIKHVKAKFPDYTDRFFCPKCLDFTPPLQLAIQTSNIPVIRTLIDEKVPLAFPIEGNQLTLHSQKQTEVLIICQHITQSILLVGYKIPSAPTTTSLYLLVTLPDLTDTQLYKSNEVVELKKFTKNSVVKLLQCPSIDPINSQLHEIKLNPDIQIMNLAAEYGSILVLEYLLSNLDITNWNVLKQMLFYAILSQNPESFKTVCNFLVEKKALDVFNVTNNDGKRIIEVCIEKDDFSLFSFLLEFRLELNFVDVKGYTLFHKLVLLKKDLKFLNKFHQTFRLKYNETRFMNKPAGHSQLTALHLAILENQPEVIEFMLQEKYDIKVQTKCGNTPLHLAILCNSLKITKSILKTAPLLINAQNQNGYTSLHIATQNANVEIIELLLDKRAKTDLIDNLNRNILHQAVLVEEIDLSSQIIHLYLGKVLEIKKLISMRENYGRTVLHYSVIQKNLEALNLLLKNTEFVILFDKDQNKKTIFHYAIEMGIIIIWKAVFEKLRECKSTYKFYERSIDLSLLKYCIKLNNLTAFQDILSINPGLNVTDANGNTMLHLAAMSPETSRILDSLLRHVIKHKIHDILCSQNNDHLAPFHLAIFHNNVPAIEIFLRYEVPFVFLDKLNSQLTICSKDSPLTLSLCENFQSKLLYIGYKVVQDHSSKIFWILTEIPTLNFEAIKYDCKEIRELRLSESYIQTILKCPSPEPILTFIKYKFIPGTLPFTNNCSILHLAAKFGSFEVVSELSKTMTFEEMDRNMESVLFYALGNDNLRILHFLLTQITSKLLSIANKDNASDKRIIELAIDRDNFEAFECLLKRDFQVELTYQDKNGLTLLHKIIQNKKDTKFLRALLEEIKARNPEILTKYINIPKQGSNETALHLCLSHNQEDMLNILLSHNPNFSCKNSEGNTPLHYAIIYNLCIELIINSIKKLDGDNSSLINAINEDRSTPLHLAINNSDLSSANLLLTEKANLYVIDKEERSLLHLAVAIKYETSRVSVISFLFKFEQDHPYPDNSLLHMQDNGGSTALHVAVKNSMTSTTKLLLQQNPNPMIKDNQGATVLHLSVSHDVPKIVDLLMEYIVETDEQIINIQDSEGNTPLHLAISLDKHYSLKALLDSNPILDLKNALGLTPLHLTVLQREEVFDQVWKAIEIKIRLSSDVRVSYYLDALNNEGLPPLQYAIMHSTNIEMIRKLGEKGAKLFYTDDTGGITLFDGKGGLDLCIVKQAKHIKFIFGYNWFVGFKGKHFPNWILTKLPSMDVIIIEDDRNIEKVTTPLNNEDILVDIVRCECTDPIKVAIDKKLVDKLEKENKGGGNKLLNFATKKKGSSPVLRYVRGSYLSLEDTCSWIEISVSNVESLDVIFETIPNCNYETIIEDSSELTEEESKRNKLSLALSNALLSCLDNDSIEPFRLLLSHKLCLNRQYGNDKNTLLHMIIKKGKSKEFLISFLDKVKEYDNSENIQINSEPLIDAQNSNSETALTLCVIGNQEQNLNALLDYEPSLTLTDKLGNNILHYVAKTGNHLIAEIICMKLQENLECLFNSANSDGCIPLHLAVKNGNEIIAKKLLEKKSCFYSQDKVNRTVLHHALLIQDQTVQSSMIKFILEYEKKFFPSASKQIVEFADIQGHIPLSYAIIHTSLPAAELLSPFTFTLKHRDNNGQSALHLASVHGNADIFDEIINRISLQESGEESESWLNDRVICYQDNQSRTALHLYIEHNNIYPLEKLLEKNPCLNLTDLEGNTLLHYAVNDEHGNSTLEILLKELKNRFSDLESYFYCTNNEGIPTLQNAIEKQNMKAVERLLKEGVQLAFKEKSGNVTFCHNRSKSKLSIIQDKQPRFEIYAGYQIKTKWVITKLPEMKETCLKGREIQKLDNAISLNRPYIKSIFHCHSLEPFEAISSLLQTSDKIGSESLIQFAGRHSSVEVIAFFIDFFKIDVFQPHETSLLESAIKYNPDINTIKEILKRLPHTDNLEIPDRSLPNLNTNQLISFCLYNSLEYSINRTDTEIFDELLKFGAKLDNLYGNNSGTILHLMIDPNTAKFVECLLKWVTILKNENKEVLVGGIPFIDAPNNEGKSALLLFTKEKLQNHVEIILKYSPKLSKIDCEDNNALHLAALTNNATIFKLLVAYAIKTGCQTLFNEKNSNGFTPLFIAIDKLNLEITEHLLKCGSSLFLIDSYKRNALHHIVMLTHLTKRAEFITLLFGKENAIPNLTRTQDFEERTPLHLAVINQYQATVQQLLNADPFALTFIDTNKKTSLHYAARGQKVEIVKLLIDSIQHEEESSHDLVWLQDRIICRQDLGQATALHHCIENMNDRSFTLLLNTKPCLDLKDKDGNSILHYAVCNRRDEKSIDILLKELTERFPETMSDYLYAENNDGIPPLQYAISNRHLKGAEKLIEYRANLAFDSTSKCYMLCHDKNGLMIEFLQKELKGTTQNIGKIYEYFAGIRIDINCWVACLLPELKSTKILTAQNIGVVEKSSGQFLSSILASRSIEPFIAALNSKYKYFTLDMKFQGGRYFKHIIAQYASREVTAHFLTLFHEPVYLSELGNKSMIEYAVLNKTDPSTLQFLLQKAEGCDNATINQEERKSSIEFCVKNAFESSLENNDTPIAFQNLLSFVSRIDYRYDHNNTLLHLAIEKAKTSQFLHLIFSKTKDMKSSLIDGVPFIDVQNSHMKTALFTCINMGQKENLKTLLEYSPDLTKQDVFIKENVLHLAVFNDLFEFVEILLKNPSAQGIVNSHNCIGLSPLHLAVKNGNISLTKLLLNFNADYMIADNFDRTILHHAVIIDDPSKREAMLKFILDDKSALQSQLDSDVKKETRDFSILTAKKDKMGYTPLHLSVILQSLNAVKLLLEFDPQSLFQKDLHGHTPLHLSIIPEKCIMDESDPFHRVKESFHIEIFENICKKINSQDKHGFSIPCNGENIICCQDSKQRTAMHYAIQHGNVQAFTKLLETGSCLDIQDDEGNALLHEAVMDPNDISCLKLLTKELKKRYNTSHLDCFKF